MFNMVQNLANQQIRRSEQELAVQNRLLERTLEQIEDDLAIAKRVQHWKLPESRLCVHGT